MSAATVTPLVNGFTPLMPSILNEDAEYEKILKLRDEVFAGVHPRLTVPAHAIRKVLSPLPTTQLANVSHTNVPPPFVAPPPTSQLQPQLPGLSLNDEDIGQSQSTQSTTEAVSSTQLRPTASGIDPVLLTKSDDLVRAETQIQRQRLEKALRDQFEQKRLDARKRPAPGEAKPDFDVNAVLAKALEVAKPDSATKVSSPGEDVSASESYDENSLYSSRAPDSTPEVGELEDTTSQPNQFSFVESSTANDTAEAHVRSSQNVPPADLSRQVNIRSGPDHAASSSTHALPAHNPRSYPNAVDLTIGDNDDDEEEEGEYSPPEAVEQVAVPHESGSFAIDPRSRPLRRYSELEETGVRAGSPNGSNMRIVRNHITSPIAPQPSRVSPLAVAKQPPILQNHRGRNGRVHRGRDESPDVNGQNLPPKKKRKLDRKPEKRRRNGKGSPDIKDEPVSPPPFHNVQPLGSGKLRSTADERAIVLDDPQPREIRYIQAPNAYLDSPTRPMSRHVEPTMPLSEPRVMSRASMRPPQEPDLRRVASMHNIRDMQPREYVEPIYDSPTRARAPSYARVDSPMRMEPARLVQDSPVTYDRVTPQSVRITRTPAPTYREVYQPEPQIRYVHEAMPPPVVERIVVDADGRKYREIIETRESTAIPRAAPNYVERESGDYYDNYGRLRAGSVFVEAGPDTRYAQEMPPPRIARQIAEAGPVRREAYDPIPVGRAASIAPVDRAPRQIVYVDDRGEFREPVRMGSVRPPPSRYEEQPLSQSSRVASVHPAARQGSVFVEDRLPGRPEYAPTPQYQIMERPSRYFDAQGREIIMEGTQDVGRRYVQQY